MNTPILVNGSMAYDVLLGFAGSYTDSIQPDQIENLSASHFCPTYKREFGGTGANIAWNIGVLQGNPVLVTAVGSDGSDYLEVLSSNGISTEFIQTVEDHVTATAIIGTDSGNRQLVFFHPGADSHSPWPDLSAMAKDFAYAISSPRDLSMMIEGIEWSASNDIKVFFDPGQQVHMFSAEQMKHLCSISYGVICNDYEWEIVRSTLGCSVDTVGDYISLLIITKGEKGVTIVENGTQKDIPACSVSQVVNPTGAGDAFRAGLLTALTENWSLVDACCLGATMGAFVVEQSQMHIATNRLDEIYARLQSAYNKDFPRI